MLPDREHPLVGRAMTLAEWARLEAPGELVDGVLVEEEMADYIHDLVVGWLITMLGGWALPRGGLIASSDARFGVGEEKGRKPDATVYLPGAKKPPARGLIEVPPSICVEVVSPTARDARRDRVDKAKEYAAFGVPYYWLVDTSLRSLEVLALGDDRSYVCALSATTGVLRDIPGCPDLTLDLAALWKIVSSVEDAENERG